MWLSVCVRVWVHTHGCAWESAFIWPHHLSFHLYFFFPRNKVLISPSPNISLTSWRFSYSVSGYSEFCSSYIFNKYHTCGLIPNVDCLWTLKFVSARKGTQRKKCKKYELQMSMTQIIFLLTYISKCVLFLLCVSIDFSFQITELSFNIISACDL